MARVRIAAFSPLQLTPVCHSLVSRINLGIFATAWKIISVTGNDTLSIPNRIINQLVGVTLSSFASESKTASGGKFQYSRLFQNSRVHSTPIGPLILLHNVSNTVVSKLEK